VRREAAKMVAEAARAVAPSISAAGVKFS